MASVAHQLAAPFPARLERRSAMTVVNAADHSTEEARLAQRAVGGDGDAFAELYRRYEKRAYNLCQRILGSEEDAADATQEAFAGVLKRLPRLEGRDLAFGSYVFTSARHACYDLIERRKRAEPSDELPEGAIPVGGGVGGGGIGFDPGDPEDDPERNLLLEARQEEVRTANATLPERQREVLALRELEDLSYDEIAEIMEMNRNSVAQLISRARINLRDALRGTALASIATSSAECERALALLAAEQDSQWGGDADWLADHMALCETCRLSREAMEEAGTSYRAWLPIAAAPLLFRETLAKAADVLGADWSETIARHEAARTGEGGAGTGGGGPNGAGAGANGASGGIDGARAGANGAKAGTAGGAADGNGAGSVAGARAVRRRRRWLHLSLVALVGAVLLVVAFAGGGNDDPPATQHVTPVADQTPTVPAEEPAKTDDKAPKKDHRKVDSAAPAEPEASGDLGKPGKAHKPDKAHGNDSAEGGRSPSAPVVNQVGPEPRSHRGQSHHHHSSSDGDRFAPDPVNPSDPAPPPPAPTPEPQPQPEPPSTTTENPPTTDPATCRDASGAPIPCPPRDPPPAICRNPRTGEVIPCTRVP
jgi:RNA polymerase sigma-70 factor (ECF subfamily)